MNLKLSECVATRNNAAYLEEPFDHLLACIHQLLLLQPQERRAQQASDTGETCEFAFSEDQLVCNFACISVNSDSLHPLFVEENPVLHSMSQIRSLSFVRRFWVFSFNQM